MRFIGGTVEVCLGVNYLCNDVSDTAMGFFRFRKTLSLGKFVRLNISKTGVFTSIGRPGATLNVKGDRVDGTVGVPGSGMSYRERISNRGCGCLLILMLPLTIGVGVLLKTIIS